MASLSQQGGFFRALKHGVPNFKIIPATKENHLSAEKWTGWHGGMLSFRFDAGASASAFMGTDTDLPSLPSHHNPENKNQGKRRFLVHVTNVT